jgi:hypothetical protein
MPECLLQRNCLSSRRFGMLARPAFADLLAEQVLWQARAAPAYAKPALRRA